MSDPARSTPRQAPPAAPDRGPYRSIHVSLLNLPAWEALSPRGRIALVVLMLSSGPAGIEKRGPAALAELVAGGAGLTEDEARSALDELESLAWIVRGKGVVWIVEQLAREPNMTAASWTQRVWVQRHLATIPAGDVLDAWRARYPEWLAPKDGPRDRASDRVSDTPSDTQKQRQKQSKRQNRRPLPLRGGAEARDTEPAVPDPPPSPGTSPGATAAPSGWLAPIAAAWEARNGAGSFPWARGGKALKQLAREHAADEIARHLAAYLAATEPRFVSLPKFADTFGQWAPEDRGPPVVDGIMADWLERETRPAGYHRKKGDRWAA